MNASIALINSLLKDNLSLLGLSIRTIRSKQRSSKLRLDFLPYPISKQQFSEEQELNLRELALQTLDEEKRIDQYNLSEWSLNPFYTGEKSIFALANKLRSEKLIQRNRDNVKFGNNSFSHIIRSIQLQARDTTFETEMNHDFEKFAQKWKKMVKLEPLLRKRNLEEDRETETPIKGIEMRKGILQQEGQKTKSSHHFLFLKKKCISLLRMG